MTRKEGKPKRKYSKEFKVEAVKLHLEQGMTQRQVAKDLGISNQVLWRWIEEYRTNEGESFPGKGRLKPTDEKIRELETKLRRTEMERDILKKAMAYFAKLPE